MIFVAILLVIVIMLLLWALFKSLKRNMALLDLLDVVASQVEESLDVLDEQYQKIDRASRTELFSDEPIVKELVRDMAVAKDAVRAVAAKLYNSMENTADDHDDEEE